MERKQCSQFCDAVQQNITFPTQRSIFPGAPPTYPKSASAISPGPLTMQPMIAICIKRQHAVQVHSKDSRSFISVNQSIRFQGLPKHQVNGLSSLLFQHSLLGGQTVYDHRMGMKHTPARGIKHQGVLSLPENSSETVLRLIATKTIYRFCISHSATLEQIERCVPQKIKVLIRSLQE